MSANTNPSLQDYEAAIARLRQLSIAHNAEMCECESRRARKLACWMIGLFLLTAGFLTAAVITAPAMPSSFVLTNFGLMSLAAAIMAWMLQSDARGQARLYANERPLSGLYAMVAARILREARAQEQRKAAETRPPAGDEPFQPA